MSVDLVHEGAVQSVSQSEFQLEGPMSILTERLLAIDGEQMKFEWNIFPGLTSLEILQKTQEDLQDRNIEPEDFEDRIIFMSMFDDID